MEMTIHNQQWLLNLACVVMVKMTRSIPTDHTVTLYRGLIYFTNLFILFYRFHGG